jgi:hypothetical protein
MKEKILLIFVLFSISGCDSSSKHVFIRYSAILLSVILYYIYANFQKEKTEHEDNEIFKNFNRKRFFSSSGNKSNISKENYNEVEVNNDEKSNLNEFDKSIKTYQYQKISNTTLKIVFILFFLGFLIRNFGTKEEFIGLIFYNSGAIILLIGLIYRILSEKHIHYTFKLFDDRLECFDGQKVLLFSIFLSDIWKLEIDYGYIYLEKIEMDIPKKVFYIFKDYSGQVIQKIDVDGLRNFKSLKTFRDEFSQIISQQI